MKKSHRSNGHEQIDIGVSKESRGAVAGVLDRLLSDQNVLLTKTRKAHWDVAGPQFYALHKLWDEHYVRMAERIDQVAERIRMLGHFPIATLSGWIESTSLKESPGRVLVVTEAVSALTRDHEHVIRSLRDAIHVVSDKHGDVGTADLLTQIIQDHEQMAWMLRAFIQGEAVQPTPSVAAHASH